MIRENSKECPTCFILITKTSGCNHMVCTRCRTHFDWDNLNVTDSRDGNPYGNGSDTILRSVYIHGIYSSYWDTETEWNDFKRICDYMIKLKNKIQNYSSEIVISDMDDEHTSIISVMKQLFDSEQKYGKLSDIEDLYRKVTLETIKIYPVTTG